MTIIIFTIKFIYIYIYNLKFFINVLIFINSKKKKLFFYYLRLILK